METSAGAKDEESKDVDLSKAKNQRPKTKDLNRSSVVGRPSELKNGFDFNS